MTCPQSHEWEPFDLGCLPEERRRHLAAHLTVCESCRTELLEVRGTICRLQAHYDNLAAADTAGGQRLLEALPDGSPVTLHRRRPAMIRLLQHPLSRAAAVLAVIAGVWFSNGQREDPTVSIEQRVDASMPIVEFVFAHTSDAVIRVEQLTVQDLIGDHLSNTVGRLPVWGGNASLEGPPT